MAKKYRIHLSVEKRKELEALIAAGKAAVGKRHRAQILLCADENHESGDLKDRDIARAVGVSVPWVGRTRCALAEHGLQEAVHGWPAHRQEPRGKLDGWTEAHLVVASCSPPPEVTPCSRSRPQGFWCSVVNQVSPRVPHQRESLMEMRFRAAFVHAPSSRP